MLRSFSYQMYEMAFAALAPARAMSDASRFVFGNPFNPLSITPLGKNITAGAELFERMTRRYGKPGFGLKQTTVAGQACPIIERVVWERPFCRLLRFERQNLPTTAAPPR